MQLLDALIYRGQAHARRLSRRRYHDQPCRPRRHGVAEPTYRTVDEETGVSQMRGAARAPSDGGSSVEHDDELGESAPVFELSLRDAESAAIIAESNGCAATRTARLRPTSIRARPSLGRCGRSLRARPLAQPP